MLSNVSTALSLVCWNQLDAPSNRALTPATALSFMLVNLVTTLFFNSSTLEVTLLHKFWNHPVTLPYMPAIRLTTLSFSSVKRVTTVFFRFITLSVMFVHKFRNQVTTELYMPVILFIAPSLSSVNLVTTLSLILVTFSTIVVHKLENQVPAPLNNSLNRVNALSFIAPKYSVTRFQIESAVSFRISPKRSQSPSIIAATPDIIPCIRSIAVPMTN